MKAKEPIATYYTPSMVNALQRSIVNRVSQETNPEKLIAISRILDDSPAKESFEERYQRAKTFAYKNFDKDYVQSLEARNFLVDEPFPAEICETKEDLERIIAESEASGECTQEEVDRMFARWKSILLNLIENRRSRQLFSWREPLSWQRKEQASYLLYRYRRSGM